MVDSALLTDASTESPLLRSSPVRSRSVGTDGGWGEGEGDTHPLLTHKNGQNLCNILTKYLRRGILLTGW